MRWIFYCTVDDAHARTFWLQRGDEPTLEIYGDTIYDVVDTLGSYVTPLPLFEEVIIHVEDDTPGDLLGGAEDERVPEVARRPLVEPWAALRSLKRISLGIGHSGTMWPRVPVLIGSLAGKTLRLWTDEIDEIGTRMSLEMIAWLSGAAEIIFENLSPRFIKGLLGAYARVAKYKRTTKITIHCLQSEMQFRRVDLMDLHCLVMKSDLALDDVEHARPMADQIGNVYPSVPFRYRWKELVYDFDDEDPPGPAELYGTRQSLDTTRLLLEVGVDSVAEVLLHAHRALFSMQVYHSNRTVLIDIGNSVGLNLPPRWEMISAALSTNRERYDALYTFIHPDPGTVVARVLAEAGGIHAPEYTRLISAFVPEVKPASFREFDRQQPRSPKKRALSEGATASSLSES